MATSNESLAPSESASRTGSVPARELAACALDAAAGRKGRDLTLLDLREVSSVADFFVLATGDSALHIRAIVRAVEEHLEETCDESPWRNEGREHRKWVVLDYVTMVVHVFTEEKRDYYDLERLWGDAPSETFSDEADATEAQLLERLDAREE